MRKDFKAGQLSGGAPGAGGGQGAPGAPGAGGAQGAQGALGAAGLQGSAGAAGTPVTKLFAVVLANNPILFAQSGVSSFTHNGPGSYTIVFNQAIGNCAWVATPGGRNGATASIDNRIVTLSGSASALTNTIEARTGLSTTPTDMTFNVAVLC